MVEHDDRERMARKIGWIECMQGVSGRETKGGNECGQWKWVTSPRRDGTRECPMMTPSISGQHERETNYYSAPNQPTIQPTSHNHPPTHTTIVANYDRSSSDDVKIEF